MSPEFLRCDVPGCPDEMCIRIGNEQRCYVHALEKGKMLGKGGVMSKVTKEAIEIRFHSVTYHRLPGTTLTVCAITLDNGFVVTGESACVDPTNYDKEIGERIAYNNAFAKLWALFGFLLLEDKHRQGLVA